MFIEFVSFELSFLFLQSRKRYFFEDLLSKTDFHPTTQFEKSSKICGTFSKVYNIYDWNVRLPERE